MCKTYLSTCMNILIRLRWFIIQNYFILNVKIGTFTFTLLRPWKCRMTLQSSLSNAHNDHQIMRILASPINDLLSWKVFFSSYGYLMMLWGFILDNSNRGVPQLDAGATLASVRVWSKLTYCVTFNWYSCYRLGTKICHIWFYFQSSWFIFLLVTISPFQQGVLFLLPSKLVQT
jgi:hypothetical protein